MNSTPFVLDPAPRNDQAALRGGLIAISFSTQRSTNSAALLLSAQLPEEPHQPQLGVECGKSPERHWDEQDRGKTPLALDPGPGFGDLTRDLLSLVKRNQRVAMTGTSTISRTVRVTWSVKVADAFRNGQPGIKWPRSMVPPAASIPLIRTARAAKSS